MRLRAFCMVRDQPHYRRDAFLTGLAAAGYAAERRRPKGPVLPGELLVIWNRYAEYNDIASAFERAGGLVLVAENGYLGRDENGIQMYALACHGHNGSGWWPEGDGSRWAKLGVELKPWRASGAHLYVRGQRGIGSPLMASPRGWHERTAERLRGMGNRRVQVAAHPGKPAVDPDQERVIGTAIAGAHACVIWSSACGVRALVEGVPVFYCAPHWICAGAARHGIDQIEAPVMDDASRLSALERMAWAQWSVAEIATGEPFRLLVDCNYRQRGTEAVAA